MGWQHGDIALVTLNSGRALRGFYAENMTGTTGLSGNVWWLPAADEPAILAVPEDAADSARKLVVIDPEDREQVERLVTVYNEGECESFWIDAMQNALRSLVADRHPGEPNEPTYLPGEPVCDACAQQGTDGAADDLGDRVLAALHDIRHELKGIRGDQNKHHWAAAKGFRNQR